MRDRAAQRASASPALISGVSPKITRMSSAPCCDRGARGEHRVRGAAPLGLHEHLGLRQRAPRLVGDRVRIRTDHHGGPARCRRRAPRRAHAPAASVRRSRAAPSARAERMRVPSPAASTIARQVLLLIGDSEIRWSGGAVILGEWAGGKVESGDCRARLTAGIAGFCYRFSRFDSFPELVPDDGGPPHAARPPRRLDRACDRGRADRGADRAHRDRHSPHRDAALAGRRSSRCAAQREQPRSSRTASSTRRRNSAASARRCARSPPTATGCRPPQHAGAQCRGRHRVDRPGRKGAAAARHPDDPCTRRERDGACTACRNARRRRVAKPGCGRAGPEPRCRRPPCDRQPDRRRIGRDQDRVRGRPWRQCDDRRAAHHVVEPEGDASPRCWKGSAP